MHHIPYHMHIACTICAQAGSTSCYHVAYPAPQPGGALLGTTIPDDMHGQVCQIMESRTGSAYALHQPLMMANLDVQRKALDTACSALALLMTVAADSNYSNWWDVICLQAADCENVFLGSPQHDLLELAKHVLYNGTRETAQGRAGDSWLKALAKWHGHRVSTGAPVIHWRLVTNTAFYTRWARAAGMEDASQFIQAVGHLRDVRNSMSHNMHIQAHAGTRMNKLRSNRSVAGVLQDCNVVCSAVRLMVVAGDGSPEHCQQAQELESDIIGLQAALASVGQIRAHTNQYLGVLSDPKQVVDAARASLLQALHELHVSAGEGIDAGPSDEQHALASLVLCSLSSRVNSLHRQAMAALPPSHAPQHWCSELNDMLDAGDRSTDMCTLLTRVAGATATDDLEGALRVIDRSKLDGLLDDLASSLVEHRLDVNMYWQLVYAAIAATMRVYQVQSSDCSQWDQLVSRAQACCNPDRGGVDDGADETFAGLALLSFCQLLEHAKDEVGPDETEAKAHAKQLENASEAVLAVASMIWRRCLNKRTTALASKLVYAVHAAFKCMGQQVEFAGEGASFMLSMLDEFGSGPLLVPVAQAINEVLPAVMEWIPSARNGKSELGTLLSVYAQALALEGDPCEATTSLFQLFSGLYGQCGKEFDTVLRESLPEVALGMWPQRGCGSQSYTQLDEWLLKEFRSRYSEAKDNVDGDWSDPRSMRYRASSRSRSTGRAGSKPRSRTPGPGYSRPLPRSNTPVATRANRLGPAMPQVSFGEEAPGTYAGSVARARSPNASVPARPSIATPESVGAVSRPAAASSPATRVSPGRSAAARASPSASPTSGSAIVRLGLVPRADAEEVMNALYGSKPGDGPVRRCTAQLLAMAGLDNAAVSTTTFGKAKTADGRPALLYTMVSKDVAAAQKLFDAMDQLASSSFPFLQLRTNDALERPGPDDDVSQFSFSEVTRGSEKVGPVHIM